MSFLSCFDNMILFQQCHLEMIDILLAFVWKFLQLHSNILSNLFRVERMINCQAAHFLLAQRISEIYYGSLFQLMVNNFWCSEGYLGCDCYLLVLKTFRS